MAEQRAEAERAAAAAAGSRGDALASQLSETQAALGRTRSELERLQQLHATVEAQRTQAREQLESSGAAAKMRLSALACSLKQTQAGERSGWKVGVRG